MEIDKILIDKINDEISKVLGVGTSTSSTYSTTNSCAVSVEDLKLAIKKIRPEYAILLNENIDHGRMFVIENFNYDKFYCKKLIIMNHTYYYSVVKNQIEEDDGFNIKVYE